MAEFIMKDLVEKNGLSNEFEIASAATSSEEVWGGRGNPVYPPAQRKLAEHGISCEGKRARQMTKKDYQYYDLLICMDNWNRRNMADPWYTGDFEETWQDLIEGCNGLLYFLGYGSKE